MLEGYVDESRQPRVAVTLVGRDEHLLQVDAVIDTGFDGSLCLPTTFAEQVELLPLSVPGQGGLTAGQRQGERLRVLPMHTASGERRTAGPPGRVFRRARRRVSTLQHR